MFFRSEFACVVCKRRRKRKKCCCHWEKIAAFQTIADKNNHIEFGSILLSSNANIPGPFPDNPFLFYQGSPTSNKPAEKYKKCEISAVIRCVAQKAMRIDGRTGVERCLDDFVLFLMSLGNDYPPVEADDALDIFGLFCTSYEGGDGKYITEYDEIVHTNFSVLFDKIASKEKEFFKKKGTKLLQRLTKNVQTKEAKEEQAILKLIAKGLLKQKVIEEHAILKPEGQLVQDNDIVELFADKIMMSYHPDMADIKTW